MDKNTFKSMMSEDLGWVDTTQVIKASIESAQGKTIPYYNLVIVMEELNELGQQVSKFCRGKSDHYDLVEEMADVAIGLEYLKQICKVSEEELQQAIKVKTVRLGSVLADKGYYK